MSWLKIDDKLSYHPKIVEAGNAAVGAWVRMMAWSCLHLTDGHVPASAARTIATVSELKILVRVGLMHHAAGGFDVHDFGDWNPSSDDVKARRAEVAEKRREAGKRGGIRSGEVRAAKQDPSKTEANDEANCFDVASPVASIMSKQKRTPVPVPVPVPDPEQQNPHNPPSPAEAKPASRPVAVAPAMSGQQSGSEDAEQAEDAERRPATGPRTLFDCLDVGSEGSSVESPAKGPKRGKADGAKKSPKAATRAAVLRDRAADIATVLELWRTQPYHGRPPVITVARQTRIADRLLEGGTVEELCEAVQGVALSAYHLGANDSATKYVDIETILRDRGQVEKFADLFRVGASRVTTAAPYRAGIQPMAPPGEECWTPGDGKNWLEDENA